MELNRYTDYSLRTLIYAGLHAGRTFTVPELASAYGISENHLVKVAHHLGKMGYLETKRGRYGGFRLALSPDEINIGQVVRRTEPLSLVECLGKGGGSCPIHRACVLKRVIGEARDAFLETLDQYTLADLLKPKSALARVLS